MTKSPVVVALDFADQQQALAFVEQVSPAQCRLKVGKEMFTHFGPDFVRLLCSKGFDVFLDLKFHDIPNTVAKAVAAAAEMGVWMVNVHASGGTKMMEAAKLALEPYGEKKPLLIAVTVLTSMSEQDLQGLGISKTPAEQVLHLAKLTQQAGLDGVVCSAWEAEMLKQQLGSSFKLITPGIRPEGSAANDQKRIMTPVEAVKLGVDYLVIGRPITQAESPAKMLEAINQSLAI